MNKWYRSAPCKGILIALEHILVVVLVLCFIWGMVYPGREYAKALHSGLEKKYEDTKGFDNNIEAAMGGILENLTIHKNFETDGKYNPDKIVDVERYTSEGMISGENQSGLAFRLGDMVAMSQKSADEEPGVIVCEKLDGTYQYYYLADFKKLVSERQISFLNMDNLDSVTAQEEYMTELLGSYDHGDGRNISIAGADGVVLYSDCWTLRTDIAKITQGYKTDGGLTLVEFVNSTPAWNGKLSEIFKTMKDALINISLEMKTYQQEKNSWTEGNTNITYIMADLDTKLIYTNKETAQIYDDLSANIAAMQKNGKYIVAAPKLVDYKTNTKITANEWNGVINGSGQGVIPNNYVLAVGVDTAYPVQDEFYTQNKLYEQYAPWMNVIMVSGIGAIILFLIIFIWLTIIAGRTKEDKVLKLMAFDQLKTEIGAAIIIVPVVLILTSVGTGFYMVDGTSNMEITSIVYSVMAVVCFAILFIGYLSLIRRIKAKNLWSNSLLKWLIQFTKDVFANRSCTFRTIACFIGFVLVQMLLFSNDDIMLLGLAVDIAIFVYVVKGAMAKQKIRKGITRIAGGEVDYNIDLNGLKGDNLDMAVRINTIGEGLNKAMEESMKSERLKTDLITNVSHDIKTPLTSIINYVELLKRENFTDTKVQGYLAILEEKAQRLKHLTEDVVEASKITSGNINLEFMNINLVELINQTNGEFAEKFANRNLKIVLRLPEEAAVIRADGKRMWRVLENIYNNAAKYALSGTRIYADLVVTSRTVEFSLKNISENALNITAEELTERFIRGDVSRGTEGSGLGLSIAKSLTEIQGGQFQLYLDGDLFKVTITYPKVYQKWETESNEL